MRKKILIVEHELTIAESLDRRLRARGYGSMVSGDVRAGLAAFDELRPDLVVVSLTLPEDGGREVCRGIRQRPLGALVPILFLGTGREEVRSVAEAIAAGADHFFRKPEGLADLLNRVVTYIGPGDESAAMPEPPPVPGTPADEQALVAALAPQATTPGLSPPTSGLFEAIRDVLATGPTAPTRSPTWAELSAAPPEHSEPEPAWSNAVDRAQGALPPTSTTSTTSDFDALDVMLSDPAPATERRPQTPQGDAQVAPETWAPARRWTDEPLEAPRPNVAAPAPPPPVAAKAPEPEGPSPFPPTMDGPPVRPTRAATLLPSQMPLQPGGPAVTGGLGFTAPRRPAHDPADTLTATLDTGHAVELERRGVAELLAVLADSGFTGRIEVAAGGVLRRVFIDGGAPVFADSSEPAEDLVGHLAAEGRITRAVALEARDRAQVTGASADEVLIDAGYLEPDDAHRALRSWVIERITALFGLEAGEATVLRGGPRPLDPVDLGLHPGRLVLDGVRRKYGRLRLYRAFGTPTTVPRPASGPRPEHPGLSLRQDEALVASLVDGRRSALEIAHTAQLHEVDTLAILHALGVLRLIDGPSTLRTGGLPPLDPSAMERAGAPRTDDQHPGFAELVAQKHGEVFACDYHQVLGVPRAATGAEVRAAWERLHRLFDPHRVRRDSPLWHQVRDIVTVVDDAWAVLGDERLRARYEAQLE